MNLERAWILGTTLALTAGACSDSPDESGKTVDESDKIAAESDKTAAKSDEATPGVKVVDAAEPVAATEPPPPPPTGHAVIRVGALLFDSSTGGVGFELPPFTPISIGPRGLTVHVVGEKDGRLELETLSQHPPEHHCAGSIPSLDDFRLRLFASPDDLLPVIVETTTVDFSDGTSITLGRGVAIPPKTTAVVAGGVQLRLPVPAESTGLFYEPGEPFSAQTTEDPLNNDDPLTYDGGRKIPEHSLYGKRDATTSDPKVALFASTPKGDDVLVTVRNPCLEIKALTSRNRLAPPVPTMVRRFAPPPSEVSAGILGTLGVPEDEEVWGGLIGSEIGEAYGVGGLGLVGAGRSGGSGGAKRIEYEVKAGTPIVWSDGRPAGQVTANHTFTDAPREQGGHSCFDVPLTRDPAPAILLCFAPGDVSQREASAIASSSLGALSGSGTIGLGGTISKGGSSSGLGVRGSGTGFGGTGKRVPRVRQAKATVKGSLDKDIIRRIVRAHINEVRSCYNKGLAREPLLKGRIEIDFVIGGTGKVTSADVKSTTLADLDVGKCVAKAVKRWKFPKPKGGGVVAVSYPFVLDPG